MKINKYIKLGAFLLIGLVIFSSCKKKYSDEYDRYNPTPVSESSVNLDYHQTLETYPVAKKMVSDTPSYTIEGYYFFGIDTAYSTTDSKFSYSKFSINSTTGVITYNNSGNSIAEGKYAVDVSVVNLTGITVIKSAFELSILPLPITATVDPANVEVDSTFEGVVSQLSYEVSDPAINSVEFTIKPSVTGFSINENGEISKTTEVPVGEYTLSFLATTNMGNKSFKDLLTVKVN